VKRRFGCVLLCTATSISLTAFAQPTDTSAAAESLFREGKRLLDAQDYGGACPKLAESYRLDPGTGTLLALALCHERAGKSASAWSEYAEVIVRSKHEGRADRVQMAQERVTALEPRLSMLTIEFAKGVDAIPSIEIKRDGVPIGPASWATPLPVDPGHHHVEATAPGKLAFAGIVTVGPDADRQTVIVPMLNDDLGARSAAAATREVEPSPAESSRFRTPGLAVGGAGLAGIAVGSVFGIVAITKNNESKANCDSNDFCSVAGKADRNDARTAGTISTISFAAGGALLAGGIAMYLLGGPHRTPSGAGLVVTPGVSAGTISIGARGAF
jgi:hypothetical protein